MDVAVGLQNKSMEEEILRSGTWSQLVFSGRDSNEATFWRMYKLKLTPWRTSITSL